MVSDRGSQFAVELMKKLSRMLGIETKLSTLFHLQTDRSNEEDESRIRIVSMVLH